MTIAHVIPLVRLPSHLDIFDYNIPDELVKSLSVGCIVEIPFRKKNIRGVIMSIEEEVPREREIKKISSLVFPFPLLSLTQIELIRYSSMQYSASPALFTHMILPSFPKRKKSLSLIEYTQSSVKKGGVQHVPTIVRYTSLANKLAFYQEKISSLLTYSDGQILFLCPTIHHAQFLERQLGTVYPETIGLLHGSLSPAGYRNEYIETMMGKKRIIIGTRLAIYAHFKSLSSVIIDDSDRIEHKNYDQNPRYDARDIALKRSVLDTSELFFTSSAPRLEDAEAVHRGIFNAIEITSPHPPIHEVRLSDEWKKKNFTGLSEKLIEEIKKTLAWQKNIFLFLNKKGSNRLVVCSDCEYVFLCEQCLIPQRYSAASNMLHCFMCASTRHLPSSCPHCHSVRFLFFGIGIEKIIHSLRGLFPQIPIREWSRETVQNDISCTSPMIIVGTSMALTTFEYLFPSIGLLGILAADPVHHLSDFRATEYQWHILAQFLVIADFYHIPVVAQAYDQDQLFVSTFLRRDYHSFIKWLMESRKRFKWPPYGRIIKLIYRTHVLPPEEYERVRLSLSLISGITLQLYKLKPTSLIARPGILIRLNGSYIPGDTLGEELSRFIHTLSTNWLVDIDPVTL